MPRRSGLYCRAMQSTIRLGVVLVACALTARPAIANEPAAPAAEIAAEKPPEVSGVQKVITDALNLIGIRYRRGGGDAERGFDCSGFVRYVYQEALGLVLPRTSREISRTGEPVEKSELQPGDLVFFKTMRHAFSHVGIYLGDNQFVHAPRPGGAVRVEDIRDRYWMKRYNGARRIDEQ
jgi:cell wall-associated NlpC family hydrolase